MRKEKYIEKYCTGCGLCESIGKCKLKRDVKGFPVAIIEDSTDINFFESICPVYSYRGKCEENIWGKIEKASITYSSNPEIRYRAASGGALTEICCYLIENQLVDGIIHVTYNPDSPTENITCLSTTIEEIIDRCGSRYSISSPLKDIIDIVEKDKKYAFVGKPCDVMALRNYMKINHELEKNIYCLLSFFCAGEPSVNAQEALLDRMGCSLNNCFSITYRGNGWPGYTTVNAKDGNTYKLEYNTSWGKYLGRDIRNICRFCMDGTGDAADIVCADFWYLDKNQKPDFSEHEGRNIAIARTKIGENVLSQAIKKGRLIEESDFTNDFDRFHLYQPHQFKRKKTMKSMILGMKLCGKKTPKYSRSYLNKYSSYANRKEKMDATIGTIKRVIKGRI